MRLKQIIIQSRLTIIVLLTTPSSPRTNPPNKASNNAALTSSCPYILGHSECTSNL